MTEETGIPERDESTPSKSVKPGTILDGISRTQVHDLRNQLGALVGSLDLVSQRAENDVNRKLSENALKIAHDLQKWLFEEKLVPQKPARDSVAVRFGDIQNWPHPAITAGAERHDLFFAAIEMTRMPMIVTDPHQEDNPIIFANNAFVNATGYTLEETLGRNCRFLQGDDTDSDTIATIRSAIANRTNVAVEVKNYRRDGTMFWNALFISPIFDSAGNLLYFFGSQLDITRRRDAEAALRNGQKMEAIGQLTGGIAHDFNNLLQVMIGNLQLASQHIEDGSPPERYIKVVSGAAERARGLTQQLLAFSRKQALDTRIANLNRVIEDLNEILTRSLHTNIRLDLDLAPDLWNTRIDTMQLEMSLINMIVNARDAIGENDGSVTIKTENRQIDADVADDYGDIQPGMYTSISIRDTGCGISSEILAHVTEPFFTTKDIGKGTGLGLAQAFGFVKQSHGYMKIDSVVGDGTTITMLFPATLQETKIAPAAQETAQDVKGEVILIVEDNQEVLDLASEILRHKGYNILTAKSAREAMTVLNEHKNIDMLFTDVVMPGGMNGLSLANEVLKMRPDISILVTTGFAEDVHGQPKQSMHEIIYKPYMPNELLRKVHNVLIRRFGHRA